MKTIPQQIAAAHRCGVPLVAIETADPASVIRSIVGDEDAGIPPAFNGKTKDIAMCKWDVINGLQKLNEAGDDIIRACGSQMAGNFLEALKAFRKLNGNSIVFCFMGDRFLNAQPIVQAIWNLRDEFKADGRMLVLIGASMASMPPELRHDVIQMSEPLPDDVTLKAIVDEICDAAGYENVSDDVKTRVVDSIRGLSAFEAEQVVAMSTSKEGISIEDCQERKRQMVEKTKGLSVFTPSHSFEDLAGLGQVKLYLRGLMNGPMRPKAVVWLDEIEKSGLAHTSDLSGVNSDSLGTVLSYMEDHKVFGVMLVGVPGCQPKGQLVLMADGNWKDISEIKVGDVIVSPQKDGSCVHATVTSTVQYKDKQIFKIKDGKHRSYRCSDDHIVPHICIRTESLEEANAHGRSHETRKTVHELTERFAADVFNYPKTKKSKLRIFSTSACEFGSRDLPVHPYVLGVLIGDGCLTKASIRITCPDAEVLEKLKSLGVQIGRVSEKPGCLDYGIIGESLVKIRDAICSMGINVLSKHKFIPDEYLKSTLNDRLELLAGLIDTDGNNREFSSASKEMAIGFAELVKSVGGIASLSEKLATCEGKRFQAWRVSFSFAEVSPPVSVPRKVANLRNMEWKNPRNSSAQITCDGIEDVYGFTVDSDSHWYVTNDWLVTHNCGKSEICKAMAKEFDTIVIRMDMGAMQGSLVGESQNNLRHALKTIDAICGDNSLFIATSNSIDGLDSALKSRFTDTFFFDLPDEIQRQGAWAVHIEKFGLANQQLPSDEGWSGRNIQRCCQKAYSLGMKLTDAAAFVIPEAVQSREVIEMLRTQASGKFLSSDNPGPYTQAVNTGRVARKMQPVE